MHIPGMPFLREFFQKKSSPGILLCLVTVLALIMKNSVFLDGFYEALKHTPVVLQVGAFIISKPLLLWINDGLMAIFFLMIGLEVKREIMIGSLSKPSQIILPTVAALGGLMVPALIYVYINWGNPVDLSGWAIPAATDIAFALGVVVLLGDRVPRALKLCLLALAIIDDLAAIIIIAFFYTAETSMMLLLAAGAGIALLVFLNRMKVTRLDVYMIIGLFIWACVLKSGVHATLAGVALGFTIPLNAVNKAGKSPLKVLEHTLHPWVHFFVLPAFAFANAGVALTGLGLENFLEPVTLGIVLGLFIGKQVGVMSFSFIAIKFKIAQLPEGVSWSQFYGMSLLAGIGFTMSLFIGTLAFEDIEHATSVRLGVLTGSLLSAIAGTIVLILSAKKNPTPATTAARAANT